jgi:CDP-diacylglycerol--glycerol-3-phosphate 3-phosphatidyltransferase
MQFNIPTLLTLFRVILIPFFVLAFYLPFSWAPFACALIFFVAAVTDWFDGYLARRWNQSTRLAPSSIRWRIKSWWLSRWCWLPSTITPGG